MYCTIVVKIKLFFFLNRFDKFIFFTFFIYISPHVHLVALQRQLICTLLEINDIDLFYENILSKVADKVGSPFLDKIVDLGLLTEEPVLKLGSPLDTFSQFIASKLSLSMYNIH